MSEKLYSTKNTTTVIGELVEQRYIDSEYNNKKLFFS